MSDNSRDDPSNVDVDSAVFVEKEDLKDKEGKVVDEAHSLSGVKISGDDDVTSSDVAIGTGPGSAHSTPPRSVKSMESSVRPTRRSPRIAARSVPVEIVGKSASPSPKKRVLRVPISAGSNDTGRKHSVTPKALSGKDTPKAGFHMGRRRKQGDTDDVNVHAVAKKDEYARDGDKKAPERLVEEEKTGEDPDKRQLECDDKPKQERGQAEGNDLGVEDSVVTPERPGEEEKTGEGCDKRLGKDDDKQKQEAEERDQAEGNDLGVEDSVVTPERLVEGGKAEKDPEGEEKGGVEDEDGMVEEWEVGEHDDSTDGGETELEEGKEEEEDDDATDVELAMEEEERGADGGGKGTEERKGLQDVEGEVEEHVMSRDGCIDGGEGDTAQERATKKRKSREENDDQEWKNDDEEGKDYDQERKNDNQEGKIDDEEGEDDDEEGEDYDQDEEEDDEDVDIDAMIKLASSAVKGQITETTDGSSGAGLAGEKRPASTAAADGKIRPRKIRRGGAIMSLDSKLSTPKGMLNAESKKKRKSLSAFVSPKEVDGKVDKLYAGSDLYSGRDRATLLKKTKPPKDETAGKGWFNMEQAEMTPELKRDLQVIRMRNYLDPKRFYKSSDKTSKFVQVGTVKEGPSEFFSSRMTNKERKKTLVDELLVADESFRTYAKNKYKSIQEKNRAGGKAHYKKLSQKRTKSPKWKL